MPARNSIKTYAEDAYYHIYNRGVEQRVIFQDDQDYGVFLSYLGEYLSPKDENELSRRLCDPKITGKERDRISKILRLRNFSCEITLMAYCLMPNHFHLFIKQNSSGAIDGFMSSLATRYSMYFNHKFKRTGSLCQGVYRAVLVDKEDQFLHLSRYIHRQALDLHNSPSSYPDYTGARRTSWVHPEEILSYFSKINPTLTYQTFVAERDDFGLEEGLTLEGP